MSRAKLGCPCAQQRQGRDHPLFRVMTKAKPLPPLEELEQLLNYDPETGVFRWRVSRGRTAKAGEIAGHPTVKGYLQIGLKGKEYYAHRLAWLFITKTDPCITQIDHINGNKLDNSAINLRLATNGENKKNTGLQKNNTSGFKGVWEDKRWNTGWRAVIGNNGKKINLGTFPTPELAHMAYCKAAAELHGEFARAM